MKTVMITGARKGLGKGFVQYFLKQGYKVFGGVRNIDGVDSDIKSNENCVFVQMDVSNDTSIKSAYELISKQVDHLDYLINNAALNKDSATDKHKELVCNLGDLDRDALLKMFNVNTISPIMVIKTFLPLLRNSSSFIVNITSERSSYKGEYPNTNGNYGYRASKAALNMMTACSLFDLPNNVKTFCVHPGGVKTDMNPTGSHNALEQAEKIIAITTNWKEDFNGRFLRFDGTFYPLI